MTSISTGLRDLTTFPVQKLSFSEPDLEDDSSRDSGIGMDEELTPSSTSLTDFGGLFAGEIKQQSPDRKVNRRLCNEDAASPQLRKNGLSRIQLLERQTPRRLSKKTGFKRKEYDLDTPNKKSRIDNTAAQNMVKSAVEKHETEMNLIGDCSRAHRLPTTNGQQQDLHYITPATMVDIITGRISLGPDTQYKTIDCRYPYEYEGGHIPGALNLHTQDKLAELVKDFQQRHQNKDTILIFHCEFSSERGPKRAKFLRKLDRQLNADKYPFLNFPEIYIMKGGYKEFYDRYSQICVPRCYIPMLHEDHRDDLKKFRSKSKSWSARDKFVTFRNKSKLTKLRLEY